MLLTLSVYLYSHESEVIYMTKKNTILHKFTLLITTVLFVVSLIIVNPGYTEEAHGSSSTGIIFRGENVCKVDTDLNTGEYIITPHDYYWVDTGDSKAFDLHCSRCNGFFGRGLEMDDGNICVNDFDMICGYRHFIFDKDGKKLNVEKCQSSFASYESEETHLLVCKCGLALFEDSHSARIEIDKATPINNGFYASYCDMCNEQLDGKTIYRPKSYSISKSINSNYAGKKVPKLTIKTSNGKILSSTYYNVKKVTGSKASKKFSYTISFKGNYKGTKTVTFKLKKGSWVLS